MLTAPPLPHAALEGVRRFNRGEYFEAHEAFEELLDDVETDARWELLIALVQVAVGYHKCHDGHPGGPEMLARALEKLAPFADDAGGLAIDALRARVQADQSALSRGGEVASVFVDPPRMTLAPNASWTADT